MPEWFGDGAFAFGAWHTPFESMQVELAGVEYEATGRLAFRVVTIGEGAVFRATFDAVSAFRVLDEHGLDELWRKTAEMGGRPGPTTFRVRNHLWTKESPISFLRSDGWSFVVATDFDCIEIVAADEPSIVAAT